MPQIYGFNYPGGDNLRSDLYSLRCGLVADLGVLHYLRDISPVLDANMFIIYGHENGIDTSELSAKDLTELASLYQDKLRAYVNTKIRSKLVELVARWDNAFKKLRIIASLPEPMYRQFVSASNNIQLVGYRFNNINTEAVVGVLHSIRNDFLTCATQMYHLLDERIPIDPAIIDKFFNFILEATRANLHGQLTDQSQYSVVNRHIIAVVGAYLRLLVNGIVFDKNFSAYDNPDAIYNELFGRHFNEIDTVARVYARKCRALDMSHVLVLNTTWIDGIILPKNPIIRDNAASKLAGLMMISATNDMTIDSCAKRLQEGAMRPTLV